jgi:pimeloyl-ACP methyl ester carboxylesterase
MGDSSDVPIRPSFTKVDGLEIRVAASGKITAPTILMLAPWPESIFAYLPIWQTLARDFSLVAFDLPGFGRSEGRADLMSPHAMGDFVIRVANQLGIDEFHAIGPDVGSPALLFTATEYPKRVLSLIVGSGASVFPLQIDGILKAMVEAPNLDDFRKLDPAQVVLGSAGAIKNYEMPQFVKDDYVASYAGNRLWDSIAYVRQYPSDLPVLSRKLDALTTPVQIIVGREDPYVPVKDAELLHEQVKNSRLRVLPGGHSIWEEQAPEYARIASEWLGGGYAEVLG